MSSKAGSRRSSGAGQMHPPPPAAHHIHIGDVVNGSAQEGVALLFKGGHVSSADTSPTEIDHKGRKGTVHQHKVDFKEVIQGDSGEGVGILFGSGNAPAHGSH
ncbi:hypothetical protein HDU97_006422 [Phlyctochytrium planicorne]|nr:hypothetical protein HDU97_006422 [Phlyctochytrium planicorne]